MFYKKQIGRALVCFTMALGLFSPFASASQFTKMVFFGDSSSDQGNNLTIIAQGRDKNNPYSRGAPISNWPGVPGVLAPSKGTVWTQYLSEDLFHQIPVVSSSPFSSTANIVNAAWASAETGDDYLDDYKKLPPYPYVTNKCKGPGHPSGTNYNCVPGVLMQIALLRKSGFVFDKNTLVFLFSGGNDIIDNFLKIIGGLHANKAVSVRGVTFTRQDYMAAKMTRQQIVDKLLATTVFSHPIENTATAVQTLMRAGTPESNIVVTDLPNIGVIPLAVNITKGNKYVLGLIALFSDAYNKLLKARLKGDASLHWLSAFDFLTTLTDNHAKYGFKYGSVACTSNPAALEACNGYIYFNDKHPSAATHKLAAESFEECLNHWYPGSFPFKGAVPSVAPPPACSLKR